MKPKAFAALLVAAVLISLFAIVSYASNNRWAQTKVTGAPLAPSLAAQAGTIARIEIRQGGTSLTLAKTKDGWTLADRANFPVKPEAVRALLVKLAEAQLIEPKTSAQDRYGMLELEDPAGKDAKSRLVRVLDDKGGVITETIVGKKRSDAFGANRSGTYVRRPGDAQTWLASADIDASTALKDWVQPTVLDLPPAKIAGVTVEIPGEEPMKLARDAAGGPPKHNLVGLPDGKKLKEGVSIDTIVRSAGIIDLDDVRKLEGTPAEQSGTVKIEADGGLAVTLNLRKYGEDAWVSIAATGDGDAKKQAEDIARRTQGWEFKIPGAKAQSILKRRADLIEVPPPPEPAEAKPAPKK